MGMGQVIESSILKGIAHKNSTKFEKNIFWRYFDAE